MQNKIYQKLSRGEHAFGIGFAELEMETLPALLAHCGFDFLFIDMEHTTYSMETIGRLVWSCRQAGISPVVRVPEAHRFFISRILDAGAHGFIVPRVETTEQVENAIRYALFPPKGDRSVSGSGRKFGMTRPKDTASALERLNKETILGVQIETKKGLENIDELVRYPEIDLVFTGPMDLSFTLGVPPDPHHPEMQSAVTKIIETARKYGHAAGMQTSNTALSIEMMKKGLQFILCGGVTGIISRYGAEIVNELKTHG
jgi:2-keto-3-deoxy-L-rhamnonate aldolase RhmA